MERATIFVQGRVQGVGFRWWVRARALELGLIGFARNLVDGRVEVCAQGDPAAVAALRALLESGPVRPGARGRYRLHGAVRQPRDGIAGFTER